jgi:hypothetical protein
MTPYSSGPLCNYARPTLKWQLFMHLDHPCFADKRTQHAHAEKIKGFWPSKKIVRKIYLSRTSTFFQNQTEKN